MRLSCSPTGSYSQASELLGGDGGNESGQERSQVRLQRNDPGVAARSGFRAKTKGGGCLFEGPVLQEPGEEQVTSFEQLEVGLLIILVLGQKAVGLERQESGGHHNELRSASQVPVGAHMGDELISHFRQRQLSDVEPLTRDETQEQVERPLELGQGNLETGETRRALTVLDFLRLPVVMEIPGPGCPLRALRRIGLLVGLRFRRHRRGR